MEKKLMLHEKEEIVRQFAIMAHADQKRKYTNESYVNHVFAVAKLVRKHNGDHNQILAAMLHDVIEDTKYNELDIYNYLVANNFSKHDASDISGMVVDLTDVYTKEAYPHLNRAARKAKETERLSHVSARSQLIKALDLLDNTSSIVEHDAKFAQVYLKEKAELVKQLTKIPVYLYFQLLEEIEI